MLIITSYNDLCGEIELLEFLLSDLQRQLKAANKIVWTGRAPSDQGVPCFVPLNKSIAQYDNIMERAQRVQEELEDRRVVLMGMEERISKLTGIEYVVAYKRDIEGKSLQVIADEMNYSYNWIKKMSSRSHKAPSKHRDIAK